MLIRFIFWIKVENHSAFMWNSTLHFLSLFVVLIHSHSITPSLCHSSLSSQSVSITRFAKIHNSTVSSAHNFKDMDRELCSFNWNRFAEKFHTTTCQVNNNCQFTTIVYVLRIEVALCIQRDKMDFFTLRTKWKSSKMFDSAIIINNEVLQTILPIYVFWVDVETRHLFEELAENTIFIWLYAAPPHFSFQ